MLNKLFGNETVDGVLADLNDTLTRLKQVEERQAELAATKREEVVALQREIVEHAGESTRAGNIVSNLMQLLNIKGSNDEKTTTNPSVSTHDYDSEH